MEFVSVQEDREDSDYCIDEYDLVSLFNRFQFHQDARCHIVWDALYVPGSHVERKMARDWVRREKLLRGLTGQVRDAMNLAAGHLRRVSNIWHSKSRGR